MIDFEAAVAAVLAAAAPLPAERLPLEEAAGRVLAADVRSRLDLPRFEQTAMDGIAVRAADLQGASAAAPRRLRLTGEIPAGSPRRPVLKAGDAVKVFTGSPLPRGADAVVIQEDCVFAEGSVTVAAAPRIGAHIRRRGEELRRGDLLAAAGAVLTPPVLGLLAGNGTDPVRVVGAPEVALVTLGDELAPPGARLGPAQIRDANGPALAAALARDGAGRIRRAHVGDDPRALRRVLSRECTRCDLVVTVGGASVGDHDHVKSVRAGLGVTESFTRVAVKPGKPVVFGRAPGGCLLVGLPGNPVSALVSYLHFVRPLLKRLRGEDPAPPVLLELILDVPLRKPAGRLEWVRAVTVETLGERRVRPLRGQGSHMLGGLARAEVLIRFPADRMELPAGARVQALPVEW